MTTEQPTPQFGINIDPRAQDIQIALRRAQIADQGGLDLIGIMDHPYNRRLYETWTLLSFLAARTEQVHLITNVANLPLRAPAMLGKMAATLQAISGGRLELGLGAGAFWEGIEAYGGPPRSPGEAYAAFEDALHILQKMWDPAGKTVDYQGAIYHARGLRPGPVPSQPIPIWVGASGPRMLRLTGKMADGILVSSSYEPPPRLLEINERIDAGAEQAGRSPDQVRRGYNLMGILDLGREDTAISEDRPGNIYGPVEVWVEALVNFYRQYRQDTFMFWPTAGNQEIQMQAFAGEVVPAVRQALD